MTYKVQINDEVRDATADEAATIEAAQLAIAEQKKAAQDAAQARANALTKLEALGLTPAEIAALVG